MKFDTIYNEDCLVGLRKLPDASVQTCITSPPYYGLRDYGVAGQIGLEDTPDAYVARLVEVFREVRRVLKNDGTCWLNLGDSYAAGKTGRADHGSGDRTSRLGPQRDGLPGGTVMGPIAQRPVPAGLKPKDLIGIPWRVAFALQADGWYLRQDIIWAKPNPMPESVKDRCTKAHEYLFLLAKSARYFYDIDAIRENHAHPQVTHKGSRATSLQSAAYFGNPPTNLGRGGNHQNGRNRRSVWTIIPKPFKGAHFAVMPEALVEPCVLAGSKAGDLVLDPFAGSGTVGVVSLRNGRRFVGCELNSEYATMARKRIAEHRPKQLAFSAA